jgi:hypothetical protein
VPAGFRVDQLLLKQGELESLPDELAAGTKQVCSMNATTSARSLRRRVGTG